MTTKKRRPGRPRIKEEVAIVYTWMAISKDAEGKEMFTTVAHSSRQLQELYKEDVEAFGQPASIELVLRRSRHTTLENSIQETKVSKDGALPQTFRGTSKRIPVRFRKQAQSIAEQMAPLMV